MNRKKAIPELRRKAETRLDAIAAESSPGAINSDKLLHELQVHQIELEMQNEVLVETLAQAEAMRRKYQDLHNFAPVGYLILSLDGEIVEANLLAVKMLGHSAEDLVGRRIQQFFHPPCQAAIARLLEKFPQTTDIVSADYLLLHNNSPIPQWVTAHASMYSDTLPPVTKVRMALMDVTSLKMANDDMFNVISRFADQD